MPIQKKCIITPIIEGAIVIQGISPIPSSSYDGIVIVAMIDLLANNSEIVNCLWSFSPPNNL